jgi:hypothetical protein
MNTSSVISQEQRINAILHMEGMPDELPLLSESEGFELLSDIIEPSSDHEEVLYAYGLNEATAVDTFIEVQQRVSNFASL